MAIELNTSSIKTSLSTDATINAGQGASQSKKLAPILGGDSLTVTSGVMTDLEELVAKLKSESADTRQSVSQRRISVLSSVLDTMSDRISASDRDALVKIEELNGDKTSAQESIATLQGEKLTTQNTITELDLQIEALERQIEQAVEDGAEHREQVAKLKEQRAEEQEKLDSIESSIKSLTNKISDIDVQISVYTASISNSTLSEVSAALRTAINADATDSVERVDSNSDRVEQEKKAEATDIANHISDALDKLEDEMDDTIAGVKDQVKA